MWDGVILVLAFARAQLEALGAEEEPPPNLLSTLVAFWRDLRDPNVGRMTWENVFLRYQNGVLRRQVKRARPSSPERLVLTWAARLANDWRERASLLIVQPQTLIRWHRDAFKAFWAALSLGPEDAPSPPPRKRQRWLRPDEHELVRDIARRRPSSSPLAIRNHMSTVLQISVHKRTVERILADMPPRPPVGQSWGTWVKNHCDRAWACDFLTIPLGLLQFRQLYVFFVISLHDRRILHWAVTLHPTRPWVAQQLREVTASCAGPEHFLRDADGSFGPITDRVLEACGAKIHVVSAAGNVYAERWVGTLRRELLDHLIVLSEDHLRARMREYIHYYNHLRPHQSLDGQIPARLGEAEEDELDAGNEAENKIRVHPILGGLVSYHVRVRDEHRLAA
jgi:putative transposase